MSTVRSLVKPIDRFQQKHAFLGFFYAVMKKHGDDHGGYKSALITYYGFLSLFPLLIVFLSITQLVLANNPDLQHKVISSVNDYIPLLGSQLQQSVHASEKNGVALVVSLGLILFGARGVASALQYVLNTLWHIPPVRQSSSLGYTARSLGIILIGGFGFIAATVLSGYTTILGHSMLVRILANVVSVSILWLTLIKVFQLALDGDTPWKRVALSAGICAVGLQLLQIGGSTLLAHQLKHLTSAYGAFALTLGILFWINLQAQMLVYSVEVDVVRKQKLYPRGLLEPLTPADKRTYRKQAKTTKKHESEDIKVDFR